MYLNEKATEAPQIKRLSIDFNARFKPKDAKFELYSRSTGQTHETTTLQIIAISDSRFTVRKPTTTKGVSVWSGLYKSAKQNITVLQKKDNKTSIADQGTWAELKGKGYKFVKILHCLVKTQSGWKTCEFELGGISAIMWGDIKNKGTDGVITLTVSPNKDFETSMGKFHSMQGQPTEQVPLDLDTVARDFAKELEEMYASHDENYKFYQQSAPVEEAHIQEEIPTINLDEPEEPGEEETYKLNEPPF